MRRTIQRLAGIGLWLVAALSAAETAEELVAKNIQARGGLEKIKSVQSMRMTGTMRLGDERLPTTLELKRPNKSRWEFTLEGQTAVQAYDGKTAWMIMPFEGQTEPQIMTDQEARDIEMQADVDGPLVDAAAKGNTIELVGKETIEGGVEAWHLRITRKNGDARDLYLDAKTYLPGPRRDEADGRRTDRRDPEQDRRLPATSTASCCRTLSRRRRRACRRRRRSSSRRSS